MQALAAAHCTHQRKGSVNYFLVCTISVIKALCGSVQMLIPSQPAHSPWVNRQGRRELAAHILISSYFHTTPLIHLCFPCDIHCFPMEWAQRQGRLLQARSLKHKRFMSPSPEHLAKMRRWERGEWSCVFTGKHPSNPPHLLQQGSCSQTGKNHLLLIQSILVKAGKNFYQGPGTSVAHGPAHRGSGLVTREALCKHATREHTPRKKKAILCFFPVPAVIVFCFNFGVWSIFFKHWDNISWSSFSYLLKQ